MKKFFLFVLAVLFVFAGSIFADNWTVTTNWTGKYSASLEVVNTLPLTALNTNFSLTGRGFLKAKAVPLMFWVTLISNRATAGGTGTNRTPNLSIQYLNGTNVVLNISRGFSSTYVRWRIFMLKPHSIIK